MPAAIVAEHAVDVRHAQERVERARRHLVHDVLRRAHRDYRSHQEVDGPSLYVLSLEAAISSVAI